MMTFRVLKQRVVDFVDDYIYYPLRLHKIYSAYLTVKRIPRKVKQVIRWLPTIYRFDWYDYSFILEVWEKSLREQAIKYTDKNTHTLTAPKTRQTLVEMADILKRLNEQAYLEEEYEKLPKSKLVTKSIKAKDGLVLCYKIDFKYTSKKEEKLCHKLQAQLAEQKAKLIQKDLSRFALLFRKNLLTLWD